MSPKKKKQIDKRKPVTELTTDELMARIFPKKVLDMLKKIASQEGKKKPRKSS